MSTSGRSISQKIQQKEEEVESTAAEISSSWNELSACGVDPLLDYEERTTEIESETQAITQQLDLETEDLQAVKENAVILNRIDIAVHAQLSTRKRALDQRLEYLTAWLSELEALASEANVGSEINEQITQLVQWAQRARQFLDRNKYAQLLSEEGSYNIGALETRIEELELVVRESADSATEQAYLYDVATVCIDVLSTVLGRVERVIGSEPAERERVTDFEDHIEMADSVDEFNSTLTNLRELYAEYETEANHLVEIAVFLDAVEETYGTEVPGIQSQIDDIRADLQNRSLKSARLQVERLVAWEQDLDQTERFRLELVRQEGDVLEAIKRSGYTLDEAMSMLVDLYEDEEVTEIEVTLA